MITDQTIENGVYAAALTPMHNDLSCDTKELARHCKALLAKGCRGVVLFGTTGEGPSFSVKEKLEVLRALCQEEAMDPSTIIMANGSANSADTVDLLQGMIALGCYRALVAPPGLYKNISDEGVIAFYNEVIRRVNSPKLRIILYHIPQLTAVPITLNIIEKLRSDTVIGIKESEGNLALTKQIIEQFPGFKVFVGNESQLLEAMALGASGTICGLANLFPEEMLSLFAQKPCAISALPAARNFIAAFKLLMQKRHGNPWRPLRPPLTYE